MMLGDDTAPPEPTGTLVREGFWDGIGWALGSAIVAGGAALIIHLERATRRRGVAVGAPRRRSRLGFAPDEHERFAERALDRVEREVNIMEVEWKAGHCDFATAALLRAEGAMGEAVGHGAAVSGRYFSAEIQHTQEVLGRSWDSIRKTCLRQTPRGQRRPVAARSAWR